MTYREFGDLVARAAASLRGLGVVAGDIVAVQLPNGWEFVVVSLAANRIGAVVNPLMPIFRARELSYMLGFAEAKVLVVPKMFRGFNHAAMAVVMFTSGTTGSPKGVMHSTNTLLACNQALAGRFHLDTRDVMLACSPLGHMTGYAAVMFLGISLGSTVVLQDVWDAKRGVQIMADEGVIFTAASTPFLSDICEVVAGGAPRPTKLRNFLCGGARKTC